MEAVGSALAVVSLALQLANTVQQVSKFLRDVRDAPKEVVRLIETLDQLHNTLDGVRQLLEQQFVVLRLPGSPDSITKALENCEKQVKTLETIAEKAKRSLHDQPKLWRTWASIKSVAKRQDLDDMQEQLRDAKRDLQFAISSNSWSLQMHQILAMRSLATPNLESGATPALPVAEPYNKHPRSSKVSTSYSSISAKVFPPPTKETSSRWYSGIFGTVRVQTRSRYTGQPGHQANKEKPIVKENVWTVRPSFASYVVEMHYVQSFGQIKRSLNIYPILEFGNPIYTSCREGDIKGLQVALSNGEISPFVLDEYGETLLHHAARCLRPELCAWLLQLGVDPDRADNWGRKALAEVGTWVCYPNSISPRAVDKALCVRSSYTDIYRMLTQRQDDISTTDISEVVSGYCGSAEAADMFFSQELLPLGISDATDDAASFPPLAMALRSYAMTIIYGPTAESEGWESFIRKLIRRGSDLHAPVPERDPPRRAWYPSQPPYYRTPLDELFAFTGTPAEAKSAADGWLPILSSEGYDVMAYLKKEMDLHAPQLQLTVPPEELLGFYVLGYGLPRVLTFVLDDSQPSVYWDWWVDPKSSTYFLRSEFKQMVMMSEDYVGVYQFRQDEEMWPFTYPAWYKDDRVQYYYEWVMAKWQRLHDIAQRRATRRLEKAHARAARLKGLRYPNMPGAWRE
ncbi:hypothetical protein GJ744_011764 [Endocarpon pusillum]|uniref:NACHT-NTPase and P-loop NTPases N-terminal domain-containing protein n=1 Tax=Endocarpon pusillum TaxID=364733 RepID=A0A8H7E2K2_9EURO|nr:hypothetical protein GJ744_011764 [Endocarpon pusillum]